MRTALTGAELARPMTLSVSLRMKDFADFQARLAKGQNFANAGISRTEMERSFLPAASDYAEVRSWLVSQGLVITQDGVNHTTVFARGAVSRVAEVFHVSFARVATADGGPVLAANPNQRCVPDVAAISMGTTMATSPAGTTYAAIVLNGSPDDC